MLKNEYSLATIGVDTTENELRNVCCVMKFHFDLGAIVAFLSELFRQAHKSRLRRHDRISVTPTPPAASDAAQKLRFVCWINSKQNRAAGPLPAIPLSDASH